MTNKPAVETGKVIDGSDINVRVTLQQYQPAGRKYKEIPGTSIRIRFENAKAVVSFTKKLKDAIPELL